MRVTAATAFAFIQVLGVFIGMPHGLNFVSGAGASIAFILMAGTGRVFIGAAIDGAKGLDGAVAPVGTAPENGKIDGTAEAVMPIGKAAAWTNAPYAVA